jgi:hypothetical protein
VIARQSLSVAVPHRFFAKSTFNSTRNGVTDPDDGAEQDNGEYELKSSNHESSP